jgi:hypothetical protein
VAERNLTDDEWTAEFRPLAGPTGSQVWEHQDVMVRNIDVHHVWSWMDGGEGGTYVQNGVHLVNVYGFAVTEVPWVEDDFIEVEIESAEDERARHREAGEDTE